MLTMNERIAQRLFGIVGCEMWEVINFGSAGGPALQKGITDRSPTAICMAKGCGKPQFEHPTKRKAIVPKFINDINGIRSTGEQIEVDVMCVFDAPRKQCNHELCYPSTSLGTMFGAIGGCPRYDSEWRYAGEIIEAMRTHQERGLAVRFDFEVNRLSGGLIVQITPAIIAEAADIACEAFLV